jgi:hypothetical protein
MQASRQREIKRMSQHRAIAKTLFEASKRAGVAAPAATDGAAPEATGDATTPANSSNKDDAPTAAAALAEGDTADAAILSWKGPKLVPELCGVHPLRLSVWRSLQYIPSLMYRLEVRALRYLLCSLC